MIEKLIINYKAFLIGTGISEDFATILENVTVLFAIVLLAFLADILTKRIIIASIKRIASKSKFTWDDIFVKRNVFNRLAHLAPALVVNNTMRFLFEAPDLVHFLRNVTEAYMVIIGLLVIDAVINALHEIYMNLPVSQGRNIKGYIQLQHSAFSYHRRITNNAAKHLDGITFRLKMG